MHEYLITAEKDGKFIILKRFRTAKGYHPGERARKQLLALRKEHPSAIIWVRGENLNW